MLSSWKKSYDKPRQHIKKKRHYFANKVRTVKRESHSVMFGSLQPHGPYCPWNSPGQNTGVGNCSLLQGIFPIQESNSGFPLCRQILFQLSHQGSWKKLRLNDKNNLLKLTQVGRSRTICHWTWGFLGTIHLMSTCCSFLLNLWLDRSLLGMGS